MLSLDGMKSSWRPKQETPTESFQCLDARRTKLCAFCLTLGAKVLRSCLSIARRAAKLFEMSLGWNPEIKGALCDLLGIRKFKIPRRQRRRKRHLKIYFVLNVYENSARLSQLPHTVKRWPNSPRVQFLNKRAREIRRRLSTLFISNALEDILKDPRLASR